MDEQGLVVEDVRRRVGDHRSVSYDGSVCYNFGRRLVDDSVESIYGISRVSDGSHTAIRFIKTVATVNDSILELFGLLFGITGGRVINTVAEGVGWVRVYRLGFDDLGGDGDGGVSDNGCVRDVRRCGNRGVRVDSL